MASDQCSLEAFKEIWPTRAKKREQVYSIIKEAPYGISDYEAAKLLGWPINCVIPRRQELEAAGRLRRVVGHRNEMGRHVNIFYAK